VAEQTLPAQGEGASWLVQDKEQQLARQERLEQALVGDGHSEQQLEWS
jgi:hypothetical protein